ncbi:MAG: hypothetical protein AAFV54_06105 [Pseudomonadota bacterium]
MSFKSLLKSASVAAACLLVGTGTAVAQGCDITEFGSDKGQLYLEAENELIANDNAAAALTKLNQLRAQELNCYEEGAALGLSAQIKIANNDYLGAAQDLETSLSKGYISAENRTPLLLSLSQIYFAEDRLETGLNWMNQWLAAGGQPNRDQKWTLAAVYNKLDDNREALKWAEQVFAEDGPNASRQVYDFLIFLYDANGELAKKAQLLEVLLERNPGDRQLWDAISGDYFKADNQRKAFEVQKAMYLGGILSTEDELMRVVNFYNSFDVPFEAARILEKEMNAGRIDRNFEKLELLANLYQVAREHERAIPVIQQAAAINNSGAMYERLGRSYADLQQWDKAEESLQKALEVGGLKDRGLAWVQIGQSRYERDDRAGAREAFRNANNRGGRGWLAFMQSEEATAKALRVFELDTVRREIDNEKKACDQLIILGGENLPEGCNDVADRLAEATERVVEAQNS